MWLLLIVGTASVHTRRSFSWLPLSGRRLEVRDGSTRISYQKGGLILFKGI
jgi:hypothetical protein